MMSDEGKLAELVGIGGLDLSLTSHRLRLHKVAFILKFKCNAISYDFEWYVKGAYSKKIADVIEDIRDGKVNLSGKGLSDREREFARALFDKTDEWLEIATLIILMYMGLMRDGIDSWEEAVERAKEFKVVSTEDSRIAGFIDVVFEQMRNMNIVCNAEGL